MAAVVVALPQGAAPQPLAPTAAGMPEEAVGAAVPARQRAAAVLLAAVAPQPLAAWRMAAVQQEAAVVAVAEEQQEAVALRGPSLQLSAAELEAVQGGSRSRRGRKT